MTIMVINGIWKERPIGCSKSKTPNSTMENSANKAQNTGRTPTRFGSSMAMSRSRTPTSSDDSTSAKLSSPTSTETSQSSSSLTSTASSTSALVLSQIAISWFYKKPRYKQPFLCRLYKIQTSEI